MVIDIFGLELGLPDLFWTIINFFLLILILKFLLINPVLKHLRARDAKIKAALEAGQNADLELANAKEASRNEIKETALQTRQFVNEAHNNALEKKAAKIAEAEKEAHDIRSALFEKISKEKKENEQLVNEKMDSYVTLLTNKLLNSNEGSENSELIKKVVNTAKE